LDGIRPPIRDGEAIVTVTENGLEADSMHSQSGRTELGRSVYRRLAGARVLVGLGILGLTMAVVLANHINVDDEDIFELDGNPQDATPTPAGEDWTRYFPGGLPGGNAVAKTFLAETGNVTIFTQGGSKDVNGITQWRHTNGSVPDKDDIQNAFAAAYIVDGELLIYFGADRTANNGDANIGFWFLQGDVGPNPDGTFSGAHQSGDIFVVAAFTSGGQTAEITAYQWVGDDATGTLQVLGQAADATCVSSANGEHPAGCAISNTFPVASPWPYTPKQGEANVYPVASFFEGGINVSSLLGSANLPCFSSFIVETRSSTSLTAQLKDFVSGEFSLCGVSMTKACVNGRLNATGTGFLYDVKGTVTNTGVGTLHDVTVTDTFPAGSTPPSQMFNLGSITTLQTVCWPNPLNCSEAFTFSSGTSNGPTNNASVAAAIVSGGEKFITADAAPATCPVVPTNPSLTVNKVCTTDLFAADSRLVVQVTFGGTVCNTGDIPLTNVNVTNDQPGSTPSIFNLGTLAVGDCAVPYGPGTYFPSSGTPGPGRYQFSDQVTATGTPSIGLCGSNATCVATAMATCPLCPPGSCPIQ
jgi:hypothetical protein